MAFYQPSASPTLYPSGSPCVMPSSSRTLVPFYVKMNGTSVIVEDLETIMGPDINWTFTDSSIPPVISKIVLSNIPSGTTTRYTHPEDGPTTWVSDLDLLSMSFLVIARLRSGMFWTP
jgi:hypothetical protein